MAKMICKCEEEKIDKKVWSKAFSDIEMVWAGEHESILSIWKSSKTGEYFADFIDSGLRPIADKLAKEVFGDKGFSGRVVNEELAKSSVCNKVERTSYFKKGIAGALDTGQIKRYCHGKD